MPVTILNLNRLMSHKTKSYVIIHFRNYYYFNNCWYNLLLDGKIYYKRRQVAQ